MDKSSDIHSEPTVLDAQGASRLLEMFPYPRQRPLAAHYVNDYADAMVRGDFLPGSELVVAHAPDGEGVVRGYLINGQHRLHALVQAKVEMLFVIKHMRLASMAEVDAHYAVEDINKRRSPREQVIALGLGERLRLSAWDATHMESAVSFIDNDFKRPRRGRGTFVSKMASAEEYAGTMRVFVEYVNGGYTELTRELRKQPALAVALATIREAWRVYGEEKVEQFWRGIALDNGLERGDPRKVAVRHLHELGTVGQARTGKASPEHTARLLATCFNAWVEGRSLVAPRVPDSRSPMHLLGTRWSKA